MNNCINLGEVSVSDEALILPLTADATGTWAFMSSFNSAYQYVQFPATEGQVLAVPVRLNESYTYTVKLFRPDNTVFNDTFYCISTMPMLPDVEYTCGTQPGMYISSIRSGKKQFIAAEAQADITDDVFKNAAQVMVFAEGTLVQEGEGLDNYTFNALYGTVYFHTALSNGQRITILYFK